MPVIIADAHVHIHNCFKIVKLLDAVFKNFRAVASEYGSNGDYDGVLLLTESSGMDWFSQLRRLQETKFRKDAIGDWQFFPTKENNCLRIANNKRQKLFIVAGRQIVTEENLEVLALGLGDDYKDGYPLEKVIGDVLFRGYLPVIPWGVGKWMGYRGKAIRKLVSDQEPFPFFLGDNRNRPYFWPKSSLFTEAEKKGILNIPGSDPLPFKSEENRPGSFGFIINGTLDSGNPFEDIKGKLMDSSVEVKAYGKLETPLRFIKNQISMQILKHRRN